MCKGGVQFSHPGTCAQKLWHIAGITKATLNHFVAKRLRLWDASRRGWAEATQCDTMHTGVCMCTVRTTAPACSAGFLRAVGCFASQAGSVQPAPLLRQQAAPGARPADGRPTASACAISRAVGPSDPSRPRHRRTAARQLKALSPAGAALGAAPLRGELTAYGSGGAAGA